MFFSLIRFVSDKQPAIKASYSVSLFVALKLHLTALEADSPAGEVRTMHAPATPPPPDVTRTINIQSTFSLFSFLISEAHLLFQGRKHGGREFSNEIC